MTVHADCVWAAPTGRARVSLRRFSLREDHACPDHAGGYHSVAVPLGTEIPQHPTHESGRWAYELGPGPEQYPESIYPWPAACSCGYAWVDGDRWQVDAKQVYRLASRAEFVHHELPVGAMWDSWWFCDVWHGDDGRSVTVRLPGGHDWLVDAEASNCTRKGDRTHHCWVRHGDPRDPPTLTVDKDGPTCEAGGGSIAVDGFHGYLRHGQIVD